MNGAKSIRIGVIGVGAIGRTYARMLLDGKVRGASLAAVCNRHDAPMRPFRGVPCFRDSEELIRSGEVDAVLIATPHPSHVPIGIEALCGGLHVLVDKPLAADLLSARRLVAPHAGTDRVFAIMFNQRADVRYRAVRDLVTQGRLGRIWRVNWTATEWFRPEAYYRQRAWRGTWEGEGGGVLLNQAPHQLDLYQWMFGMPERVRAHCAFGKYHRIEVEDEVTAFLEHAGGMTSVFVTSTGEAPGSNRLEICGDRGRLVLEGGRLVVETNRVPASVFCRKTAEPFGRPAVRRTVRRISAPGGQHAVVIQNFVDAIRSGKQLIAPAEEGLKSLELANAMIQSSVTGRTVDIPLDPRVYARILKRLNLAGASLQA
jgi:predicted dehydrogenase